MPDSHLAYSLKFRPCITVATLSMSVEWSEPDVTWTWSVTSVAAGSRPSAAEMTNVHRTMSKMAMTQCTYNHIL